MTISSNRLVKISRYLSYHLRHHPDKLGLKLAPGGWVEVDKLLTAAQKNKFPLSLTDLKTIVAEVVSKCCTPKIY